MIYLPLQIIVSLFVLLVVFRLFKKFQDNTLKISEFLGWLMIWLVVLTVFWLPQTTSYLARWFGIGRGVDLAIYSAVLILFYLIFRLYLKLDRQQRQITKIIRHLALTDNEKDNLKD
ncbi:MAG: DUF2304 family protein [Patescibacteria group bacterium]|jgi:hypothetical protein